MFDLLSLIAKSVSGTTWRRWRQGPKRPSWSWWFELQVEVVRRQNLDPSDDLSVRRAAFDQLEVFERMRKRVTLEQLSCNGVPAWWITPPELKHQGVLLYFHGGSYIMGSTRSHLPLLASMACLWGVKILSAEYRLAPEAPCPAGIEDAQTAYRWLCQQLPPAQIAMGGDSAGGGLSLACMVALQQVQEPLPCGALLLSPWVDLSFQTMPSLDIPPYDYMMPADLQYAASLYAGSLPMNDPRVSPLFADLRGLPPLYILVGGVECLLEESIQLAQKAKEAGVDVTLDVAEDEVHVFPAFGPASPQTNAALARMGEFVAQHLA